MDIVSRRDIRNFIPHEPLDDRVYRLRHDAAAPKLLFQYEAQIAALVLARVYLSDRNIVLFQTDCKAIDVAFLIGVEITLF